MASKRVVFTLYFIIVSCTNTDDVSLSKRESFLPYSLLIIYGKFTQKSYRKTFTIQLHSLPAGITNIMFVLFASNIIRNIQHNTRSGNKILQAFKLTELLKNITVQIKCTV